MASLRPTSMAEVLALCASLAAVCATIAVLRLYHVVSRSRMPRSRNARRPDGSTCKLSVFLGSGGHTSEALAMIFGLDFNRYQPRVYYVSDGDSLSAHKAIALEQSKIAAAFDGSSKAVVSHRSSKNQTSTSKPLEDANHLPYSIVVIPRARRVHQSLLTTPATAFVCLLSCIYHISVEPFLQRYATRSTSKQGEVGTSPSAKHGANRDEVLVLNGPGTCLMLAAAVYLNRFLALPSPVIIYVESFARVRSLSLSGKLIQPLADRFIVQWEQLLQNVKTADYHGLLV